MNSVVRSKLVRSGDRITEALAEVDHGLPPEADGPRLEVLPVLVAEHGARDVEVCPGHPRGDELAEEEAGGDGSREAARPDVVEVGERRLQRLAVLLGQRQLPQRVTPVLPRSG